MFDGTETTYQGGRLRGFTLIEMLIVLVLISIICGAAVVSLHGRARTYELHSGAKDLAAAIEHGLHVGRFRDGACRLTFLDGMRSFRVDRAATGEYGLDYVPVRGMAGRVRTLAAGVEITRIERDGTQTFLPVNWLDLVDVTGVFTGAIELKNASGEVLRIEVLGETGQVDIIQ